MYTNINIFRGWTGQKRGKKKKEKGLNEKEGKKKVLKRYLVYAIRWKLIVFFLMSSKTPKFTCYEVKINVMLKTCCRVIMPAYLTYATGPNQEEEKNTFRITEGTQRGLF